MSSPVSLLTRLFVAVMALGVGAPAVVAQAPAAPHETHERTSWWLPPNVFPAADPIDTLFYGILYLTVFVCVAVFAVMGWFLIRYRHRPGRSALFIHGNNRLETVWTLIPAVILAGIAALSQSAWSNVKRPPTTPTAQQVQAGDVIEMRVVGKQFKWYFQYPGPDGKLGPIRSDLERPESSQPDELIGLDRSHPDGKDDVVLGVMVIPRDKRVYIHLTSVDVIHSFFLPNFRIKQDSVPGLTSRVWIESPVTSDQVVGTSATPTLRTFDLNAGRMIDITHARPFDIVCAELCGQGHYTMRGEMYVLPQEDYDRFMAVEIRNMQMDDDDAGY